MESQPRTVVDEPIETELNSGSVLMAIFEYQHRARRGATLVEIEDAIFGVTVEPRSLITRFTMQKILSEQLQRMTVESYTDDAKGLYFYRLAPQAYERFHEIFVGETKEPLEQQPHSI